MYKITVSLLGLGASAAGGVVIALSFITPSIVASLLENNGQRLDDVTLRQLWLLVFCFIASLGGSLVSLPQGKINN
jgi:hypothetical protein